MPQQQEIPSTLNPTDENLILTPSFSDGLFDKRSPLAKLTKPHQLDPYKYSAHKDIHCLPHPCTQQTAKQLCIHQPPSQSASNLKVHHPYFHCPSYQVAS